MANPVDFEYANYVFEVPADVPPDEGCDLPVYRGDGLIVSCWRLTPEDLAIVNETGVVWLAVLDDETPPVCVVATGVWEGPDPKAEPYIKPAPRRQE